MKVVPQSIPEVLIIEPEVHRDKRGFSMEVYHQMRYCQSRLEQTFVQDNLSFSVQGALRGLHYQLRNPQAKLVQVLKGAIFDVAVDIRLGSPTFGQWVGIYLTDDNSRQTLVPEGFAHGFCALSKTAIVIYKCTDFYDPEDDGGILWSDPTLGIHWPVKEPLLSPKDSRNPCVRDLSPGQLPVYQSEP